MRGQAMASIGLEKMYSEKGNTWPKILKFNYEKYGDTHIAMRYKQKGIWQPYTWKDYYTNVKQFALGLLALGLEAGDKVIIVGDNAPQWYYAELAAQANHGVSVGVYSDLTPQEIKYFVQNSDAKFAVVEDQEQVDKLIEIKDELPNLKKIVYWDYKGLAHYNDPILMGYEEVLELGRKYEAEHPGVFEQNVESGNADDVCAIVYTSGTTGTPKGAIHSYRTMEAGATYYLRLDPWYENDNIVPYLPPAWITEQWTGIGCHLLSASILNFAEEPETQKDDFREIGPSVVIFGARIWEAQAGTVQARIQEADAFKRFVFRLLMPIGYKIADLRLKKQKPGILLYMLRPLAYIALVRPVRDSLGLSNARICYSTGTVLSPEVFRFYHALNLPLNNIYESTEGGALTGARRDDIRLETVGPPHRDAEVRISDKGELIYKQSSICLGYYNDPIKTAEAFKYGWFYSGDCGSITEDGHIIFLDRMDDLVEMVNGDKLTPQLIESRLRFNPYIKDAWVTAGPDRTYAAAVIVIDFSTVGKWAGQNNITYSNFTELSQSPEVYKLVKQSIEKINDTLPPEIRVKKFVNLHTEFDPVEGDLTRNRKLRRAFLEKRYRELVNAIYNDKPEVPIEVQVKYRDGRTGTIKTTISIKPVEEASR